MASKFLNLKQSTKEITEKRTAVITGASSGLGVDFAKQLAAAGTNLILVARSEDKLAALKGEIQTEHSVDVEFIGADLTKANSAKAVFEFSKDKKPSILINNAGVGLHGDFLTQSLSKSIDMINLNVSSLVKLSHLFGDLFKEKSDGYMLQLASVAGFMPLANYSVYAATKAFVLSFSQSLNWELAGTGVSSTALCPGATKTAFFEAAGHTANKLLEKTMMSSSEVATIGLEAMFAREDKVIAGMMNKITVSLSNSLPNAVSRRLSAEMMK